MPATRAVLIAFFSSFLLHLLTVLMKQARQSVSAIKQSIYLDVYDPTIVEHLLVPYSKVRVRAFINFFKGFLAEFSVFEAENNQLLKLT